MTRKSKVLIIRFNSIGDIVLTSPVVKALDYDGYEVHYLAKEAYTSMLYSNPQIEKVWKFKNEFRELIRQLKKEKFDYVVDLHNNYRSFRIKSALSTRCLSLKKPRIKLWLLTNLGIKLFKPRHIVHRYLDVIAPFNIPTDHLVPEFYFSNNSAMKRDIKLPDEYIVICISTAYKTKTIPDEKIIELIESIDNQVVLLGGKEDIHRSEQMMLSVKGNPVNLVGKTDIELSAIIISNAQVVITGDTGMMHISTALNRPTISIFGSTHPVLGYTPFKIEENNNLQLIENSDLHCRPCTKQGRHKCPRGHFKCMKEIKTESIIEKIKELI